MSETENPNDENLRRKIMEDFFPGPVQQARDILAWETLLSGPIILIIEDKDSIKTMYKKGQIPVVINPNEN
jgi:hypothetical protein